MADDKLSDRIDPLSDAIQLSDYVKRLPLEAKQRYAVKLLYDFGRKVLPDPYDMKKGWSDSPKEWPNIEFGDIYCYLIETPGSFTRESLKAYKSLDAYRYVVSGHVHAVEINTIGEDTPFCAVRTKVTPSQRVTEKPHQPWAYLDKETASVYCAHCTCLAGLGEVCSHVAALLLKMEMGVRMGLTSVSSTSEVCKWNSSFRKQLEPMTVEELQPMLKAGNRTKPVESVIASGRDPLPSISLLEDLKKACPNAVFFTTIPPLDPEETATASETGIHQHFVQPLRDLYKENVDEHLEDHRKIWEGYKCSEQQVIDLEKETRGQAVCPTWYEQRKGRITGTKVHDVIVMRNTTKPDNLVRLLTGSKHYSLTNKKSVKWGTDNEDRAKLTYANAEKMNHSHLHVQSVGLLVDHRQPFLAVSADGVVKCECCPSRLLEIKCPYVHRSKKISKISDKDFCLDSSGQLKQTHRYYSQIQLQLHVYKMDICHLYIFTNVDSIIVPVSRNREFCNYLVNKCENFFFKYVLPELITRKLELDECNDVVTGNDSSQSHSLDENTPTVWCLCEEPEYGRMILCCNEDCPTQWFHYECVNVRRCPKGKWVCPGCSELH